MVRTVRQKEPLFEQLMKILIAILIIAMGVMAQTAINKTVINEEAGYQTYKSSAYCLQGRGALGTQVNNTSIAVDPRFVPLGSTVEILGMGTFKAIDTGGAIKGKIIDIHMSCSNAIKWGRKLIKIRILPKKKTTD